jgi:hypothetical protein
MQATIGRAEREVQSAVDRVRRCAEHKAGATLSSVEAELWTALLALGRAVVTLLLLQCAAHERAATHEHDGIRYVLDTGA